MIYWIILFGEQKGSDLLVCFIEVGVYVKILKPFFAEVHKVNTAPDTPSMTSLLLSKSEQVDFTVYQFSLEDNDYPH